MLRDRTPAMTETLRNPTAILIAAAKLYHELALSALTLLPSRPRRVEVPIPAPRLVEASAR
jgi:hypothetical protein